MRTFLALSMLFAAPASVFAQVTDSEQLDPTDSVGDSVGVPAQAPAAEVDPVGVDPVEPAVAPAAAPSEPVAEPPPVVAQPTPAPTSPQAISTYIISLVMARSIE